MAEDSKQPADRQGPSPSQPHMPFVPLGGGGIGQAIGTLIVPQLFAGEVPYEAWVSYENPAWVST